MEYELNGVNLVIHLPAELDHHSIRTLPQDVELLLGEYKISRVVFDFSMVTFMDSSGIGAILGRYKSMRERGGDISLYGMNRRIAKLLTMAGIGKLAVLYEDKGEALKR